MGAVSNRKTVRTESRFVAPKSDSERRSATDQQNQDIPNRKVEKPRITLSFGSGNELMIAQRSPMSPN
ncbi:MAG TPA: hypothetical protein DCE44_14775 [Verrucomicrobiales bacterium]|nr:hypothetical protein [Verrucomicrobiales bacterium]